jgi:hypothetical protein
VGENDSITMGEHPAMDAPFRTIFNCFKECISIPPRLFKRVAHFLSVTKPRAASKFWNSSLHFNDEQSAIRMQQDEVRLAFSQGFVGQIACWPKPRERVEDDIVI